MRWIYALLQGSWSWHKNKETEALLDLAGEVNGLHG
jgi:hypothetical protein